MTAVSSEIFVSTNETCFERTKMQLMETEILHKITTMKGEETVNSEFNNLVSGGDSSKYDRLDRKTAMEAFLRYGLLSSLEDLGLLGSVHADLSRKNGGLAASLRKWEPVIAKANTEKWYMWKREKKEKNTYTIHSTIISRTNKYTTKLNLGLQLHGTHTRHICTGGDCAHRVGRYQRLMGAATAKRRCSNH